MLCVPGASSLCSFLANQSSPFCFSRCRKRSAGVGAPHACQHSGPGAMHYTLLRACSCLQAPGSIQACIDLPILSVFKNLSLHQEFRG